MNKQLQKFQTQLSAGSLGSYIHWVNQIPMLTLEQEQAYAYRLQKDGDLESARALIMSHLRLVVRIARGYNGYGLQQADLIQEGNIGLMKAVKRFDPTMGVRLVSFAIHWIRAEIHEFILRNWRIVKVATTKAQRKLFFNLRKYAKKLSWLSNEEVSIVANELNVPSTEVRKMEQRLSAFSFDESFDSTPEDEENNTSWSVPANYLEDQQADPAKILEHSDWSDKRDTNLDNALAVLDDRARDIVKARWLSDKKTTLTDLADQYGVSAERIRQLEKNAFDKIRSHLATQ